ncbi:MarR family transcriptional regulator [Aquabacter sp. CN5-332]|uniref:MarR family transcriptional regulator n=1 Tax=Aquabacter sp. CN5-332 TaxID=3156608 RepID=UPI0032B51664
MHQKLGPAALAEIPSIEAVEPWNDAAPLATRPPSLAESADNDSGQVTHLELARVIERIHRRYCDLLRVELTRLGIDDISPPQVMLLFTIGADELSVRDLLERGHYLGSNASYYLKQLADADYIHRTASARDRRSARIRLAEKGRALCDTIRSIDEAYHRLIARDDDEVQELTTTFHMLRRLEVVWTTTMRYGEA